MTCLPLVPSLLLALTVALTASAAPQTTAASNTADATATDATAAAAAATVAAAAAVAAAAEPTSIDDVVYDQRQNGTENVRISLSDLKVVLAPADGLFQIMSMAGAQLLNSELANAASEHRPTAIECNGFKCNNRHRQAAKKNRFKLSSLIAPLLQNSQAEQKIAESESGSSSSSNNNN